MPCWSAAASLPPTADMAAKGQGGEVPVKLYTLNPKAVTMGQLYGQEDAVSKEWTDGVLPVLFRCSFEMP